MSDKYVYIKGLKRAYDKEKFEKLVRMVAKCAKGTPFELWLDDYIRDSILNNHFEKLCKFLIDFVLSQEEVEI